MKFNPYKKISSQNGVSLIEVILAGAIFSLVITTLVGAYLVGQESTALAGARERATHLVDEGMEATRNIRDENFGLLVDGVYGITQAGGEWTFAGVDDTTDAFTRQVEISFIDTATKKIVTTVTWQQNKQRVGSVTMTGYLTNWRRTYTGPPDWTNPAIESSVDIVGKDNGTKIQTQGNYAYLVRNSGVPEFSVIDISNTGSPAEVGTVNASGVPNNIAVSGNYAYLATSGIELQIVDISVPTSPTVVGGYNAAGGADARGVFIDGTTVYIVRSGSNADELFIIDVSIPSNPSFVGSLNLSARANEIVVIGPYAYIASNRNSQELQVVDISTPSAPTLVGSYNLGGRQNGLSITGFGSTVVLGRAGGELQLFDVSTPSAPTIIGTYDANNHVYDVDLGNSNQYIFAATRQNNEEFQLIDISTPSAPIEVSRLNVPGRLNGIAYNAGKDRAVGAGTGNGDEFIIIMPQ